MNNDLEILAPLHSADLRRIAGLMIPADETYGVPGADDSAIFDDLLSTLGRELPHVRVALQQLAALAGGPFSSLPPGQAEQLAATFLATNTPEVAVLGRLILQCYYRDERVLHALGVDPRPPFPRGHTLENGDWRLLDAVRTLPPMWRAAR
jgi:hypothetical protein